MENIDKNGDITMQEILEICTDFLLNPEEQEVAEKFDDLRARLVIRPYLSLEQKEIVLSKTIEDIVAFDTEAFHFAVGLELSLTFNCLMAYVTNLDYDMPSFYKIPQFYDTIWVSGLGEYIVQYCEKDYEHLKDMVYQMLSFTNLKMLLSEISDISGDSINKLTQEFKSYKMNMNPDLIKNLADITRANDSLLHDIKDNIIEGAWKKVHEVQEAEKEKEVSD